MSLFPGEEGMAQLGGSSRPHVSFKAGRMSYDASTGTVTANSAKGVLQVVTADDALTHLQWRTRPNGEVDPDLDLIVFPGETEMKRVRSSSGRVYVLKWLDAATRMFFWMQDPDENADNSKIERLNAVLQNGPPTQQTSTSPNPSATAAATTAAAPATSNNPSDSQSKPATAPTPTDNQQPNQPITLESLSRMLDALPGSAGAGGAAGPRTIVSVGELLRESDVTAAAEDSDLTDVYATLPESEHDIASVKDLLRCEPLQAQALALTRALHEASAAEVLPSLGLLAPNDPNAHGIKALIEAVKKLVSEKREGE